VNTDEDQPFFVASGSALHHAPAHNYLMLQGSTPGTFIQLLNREA
jgi:hypothetical protein